MSEICLMRLTRELPFGPVGGRRITIGEIFRVRLSEKSRSIEVTTGPYRHDKYSFTRPENISCFERVP